MSKMIYIKIYICVCVCEEQEIKELLFTVRCRMI